MAYRIQQFDGLSITDITRLHDGGSNDIGSGDALTSFNQLPGGGFFDNYGANDSPQNIRPITRNCVLWGDTEAQLIANLKSIRGKIGRRGRLTVQFDDGSVWWQWARLQKVHTPRPQEAKGNYLPCNLTWISASQMWYGIVQSGDTWEVGDDTFYLGDGTVGMGMNDYSYNFTELSPQNYAATATLPNAGNAFVRNLYVAVTLDSLVNTFLIDGTNGQYVTWTNPSFTGEFTLIIDTGSKSCLVRQDSDSVAITSVAVWGLTVRVTATAHGLSSGDSVEISGTTTFDGIYHDITVVNSGLFTFPLPNDNMERTIFVGGTLYPIINSYADLTVYDRKDWLVLLAGNNYLAATLSVDVGTPAVTYAIQYRWYDHYK